MNKHKRELHIPISLIPMVYKNSIPNQTLLKSNLGFLLPLNLDFLIKWRSSNDFFWVNFYQKKSW